MRVQSIQRAKCAVAKIALIVSAVECALCHIVGHDMGRPAFYAARDRNRRHYPECVYCRNYLFSQKFGARARFNVKCD